MLNKIRKLQNKKGFTLVELIVVIAIIAILTAVIVPLVSRYTTQATYTSLQAGADSISSQANAAIAAYSMTGKVFPYAMITCEANSDGTPGTISVYKKTGAGVSPSGDSLEGYEVVPMDDPADNSSLKKMQDSIQSGLKEKLAGSSFFVVAVENGGVTGVIYAPDGKGVVSDSDITGATKIKVSAITGYDDAYMVGDNACGLLGTYKTAASKATKDSPSEVALVPQA